MLFFLIMFFLLQLASTKLDKKVPGASDDPNLFWVASQTVELDFDVGSRSLVSGETEIRLQKQSGTFDAEQNIAMRFDYKKNTLTKTVFREGWDDYESYSIRYFVPPGMAPFIIFQVRDKKEEKGRATVELEWDVVKQDQENFLSNASVSTFEEYITFERSNVYEMFPILETSHLPILHVVLNIKGTLQISQDGNETRQIELIVLSNGYSRSSTAPKHSFESPMPMMPHLMAFAILDASQTKVLSCSTERRREFRSAFSAGVTFYLSDSVNTGSSGFNLDLFCQLVDATVDYCVRRMDSEVTTPGLKFLVTDDVSELFTFRPGLVRIKASQELHEMIEAVVYLVARHWTTGLTDYEEIADIWFEEALAMYITMDCLQKMELANGQSVPISRDHLYTLSKEPSLVTNRPLLEALKIRGARIIQEKPELLSHAARTLANLNDDMHGGLLKCLAGAKSFQSGTTVPIIQTTSTYLDKMTQCPIGQHNVDVKNFLMFWYSEDTTPVLILHTEPVTEKPSIRFWATHDFLCKRNYPGSACTKVERNYPFRLAFSLYHMNGSVLQSRIYYENPKGRENRYFLNFSPNEKDTLFVANAEYKSNFLVQYPNHVYENFFKYLDTAYSKLDTQGVCGQECQEMGVLKNGPVFFLLDLFELSRRYFLAIKWTTAYIKHLKHFEALGFYSLPEMQRMKYFELLCLGSLFPHHLSRTNYTNNVQTFLHFFCEHANVPPEEYRDGNRTGCQYPIDENKVEELEDQQPSDWKTDCQFWLENF